VPLISNRRALGVIHHHNVCHDFLSLEFEPELFADCGEERGSCELRVLPGGRRSDVVRRPFEFQIVDPRKSGSIRDRTFQYSGERVRQLSHGPVIPGNQAGADCQIAAGCGRFAQSGTTFGDNQRIGGYFLRLIMHRQLEPFAQKIPQQRLELFVLITRRWLRRNVEYGRAQPVRPRELWALYPIGHLNDESERKIADANLSCVFFNSRSLVDAPDGACGRMDATSNFCATVGSAAATASQAIEFWLNLIFRHLTSRTTIPLADLFDV